MAGTRKGGLKAGKTNKERYGQNFYRDIGAIGGRLGRTGGFASYTQCSCDLITEPHFKQQCAGKKGGSISKRGKICY